MKIGQLQGYNPETGQMDDGSDLPKPAYEIKETLDSDCDDITSIENWYSPIATIFRDWSRRRDEIIPLIIAITHPDMSHYGDLNAEQKLIAAEIFTVPYSLRVTNGTVTEEQDKINWTNLLVETKQSRLACTEAMRLATGQRIRLGVLTLAQTQQFFIDVSDFVYWFEQSNCPDLIQWITNKVGSPYENNGFAQKSYYNSDLKDSLVDIYNGNY